MLAMALVSAFGRGHGAPRERLSRQSCNTQKITRVGRSELECVSLHVQMDGIRRFEALPKADVDCELQAIDLIDIQFRWSKIEAPLRKRKASQKSATYMQSATA